MALKISMIIPATIAETFVLHPLHAWAGQLCVSHKVQKSAIKFLCLSSNLQFRPQTSPPHRRRVWHTSSHFLFLLAQQLRILDYQSDCRHVILSCDNAIASGRSRGIP